MSKAYLLSAIFVAAAFATPVQATDSDRPSVLAPGEVSLEVASKGNSTRRADKATILLSIRCSGDTPAEARAAAKMTSENLRRELQKLGVPAKSILIEEPTARAGFIGNEAVADMLVNVPGAGAAAKPKSTASLQMRIDLAGLSVLPRLRDLLEREPNPVTLTPSYTLNDPRPARNAAIEDAVRNARADADAYAASLGMRVARVVAIRDQSTQPMFIPDYEEMMSRFTQTAGAAEEVQTNVRAIVEFAIVPR